MDGRENRTSRLSKVTWFPMTYSHIYREISALLSVQYQHGTHALCQCRPHRNLKEELDKPCQSIAYITNPRLGDRQIIYVPVVDDGEKDMMSDTCRQRNQKCAEHECVRFPILGMTRSRREHNGYARERCGGRFGRAVSLYLLDVRRSSFGDHSQAWPECPRGGAETGPAG